MMLRKDIYVLRHEFFTEKKAGTVLISRRVDGRFTCPKCFNRLITPATLNHHLGKMHEGRCSTASKRRKRSYSEVDNNDNSTDNTGNTDNTNNNSNNNNSLSISLKQHQMRAPHLKIWIKIAITFPFSAGDT